MADLERWKLDVMREAGAPEEPARADFGTRVPRCSHECPYREEHSYGWRGLGFCKLFGVDQYIAHPCEPVICAMSMRLELTVDIDNEPLNRKEP